MSNDPNGSELFQAVTAEHPPKPLILEAFEESTDAMMEEYIWQNRHLIADYLMRRTRRDYLNASNDHNTAERLRDAVEEPPVEPPINEPEAKATHCQDCGRDITGQNPKMHWSNGHDSASDICHICFQRRVGQDKRPGDVPTECQCRHCKPMGPNRQ